MTVQSKFATIPTSCIEYVHPWTESCTVATAGLVLEAAQDSFRIYTAVYAVSNKLQANISYLFLLSFSFTFFFFAVKFTDAFQNSIVK